VRKTPKEALTDILGYINDIESFTRDLEYDDFKNQKQKHYSVLYALLVIGEAVKRVPESFRSNYREIPWKEIAGMRDVMIHDYIGIDLDIVWKTCRESLPSLKLQIERILEELDS